jgi:uncharacterized phage infection (PIP) family protein YhgE
MRLAAARVIAFVLIAGGVGGLAAAWVGWRLVDDIVADLRDASTQLPATQAQVVVELREARAMVDDAAAAVDGFAVGMQRARAAAADAGAAATDLARSFERMRQVTQLQVGLQQPLEGLSEPFAASADSFQRLSGSLDGMADASDESAMDTARVANDLEAARAQIDNMAATVEAFRPRVLARQGIQNVELGMRFLLGFILVEGLLSILTGLAILLLPGSKRASE